MSEAELIGNIAKLRVLVGELLEQQKKMLGTLAVVKEMLTADPNIKGERLLTLISLLDKTTAAAVQVP